MHQIGARRVLFSHKRRSERTSTDPSKGNTVFQPRIVVCLNSQQFTAGENIEVAVSIQLCMHARAPTHKKTHQFGLRHVRCKHLFFIDVCVCVGQNGAGELIKESLLQQNKFELPFSLVRKYTLCTAETVYLLMSGVDTCHIRSLRNPPQ